MIIVDSVISKTVQRDLNNPKKFIATIERIIAYLTKSESSKVASIELLLSFDEELNAIGLSFNEKIYTALKMQSEIFISHLALLGLSECSLQEYTNFLKGQKNKFYDGRISISTLCEIKKVIRHYFNLMNLYKPFRVPKSEIIGGEIGVNYIIKCQNLIVEIRELFAKIYGPLDMETTVAIFMNLTDEKLRELFDGYTEYTIQENSGCSQTADTAFLKIIINELVKKQINDTSRNRKLRIMKINEYEVFPSLDGVSNVVRAQLKESIVGSLNEKMKLQVEAVLGDGLIIQKSTNFSMSNIRKLAAIYEERAKRYLNPIDKYDYFPLEDNINEQERKKIVDIIFSCFDDKCTFQVEAFLQGIPTATNDDYNEGKALMVEALDNYMSAIKRRCNPGCLYEIMPEIDGVSLEYKKLITKMLLADITKSKQEILNDFYNGEHLKDRRKRWRINNLIVIIIREYNVNVKNIVERIRFTRGIASQSCRDAEFEDLPFSKIYTYSEQLRILEEKCRKYNKNIRYITVQRHVFTKIFREKPTMSFEELLIRYIDFMNRELEKIETQGGVQM